MALSNIIIAALVGLLLSAYSLYVERKTAKDKNYKPLCDISDRISCSKAFSSKYGSIAGLPNSFYGLVVYSIIIALSLFSMGSLSS